LMCLVFLLRVAKLAGQMTCQAGFAGDSQVLYSMDSYGDVNVGQTAFDAAINWADDVIVRECSDCAASHALIYYKRLTPLDSTSIYNLFLVTWASANNALNVDFRLHSTLSDAQDDVNRWTYCNYDLSGFAFPRDCGPSGAASNQYNSLIISNTYSRTVKFSRLRCTTCPQGKYKPSAGTVECTDCDVGFSTSSTGAGGESTVPPFSPYYRFVAADYDAALKTWTDSSGNSRSIPSSRIGGTPAKVTQASGSNGVAASFLAVSGGTSATVDINNPQMSSYTFCAVVRYSGNTKGRIFDGGLAGRNWLSGFHGAHAGVCYQEGWLGRTSSSGDTNWHVLCAGHGDVQRRQRP